MTDGPNGARGESYVSGIKAACFPCAESIAASFDDELAYQIGREIAFEAKSKSADVLLAPTVCLVRRPLFATLHSSANSNSYNKVNGTYASEHPRLLTDILRKEWGFEGLVVSDWVGTYSTAEAINAGLDLEMPAPRFFRGQKLLRAVEDGEVSLDTLNERARRVIELVQKTGRLQNPEDKPEVYRHNLKRDEFIARASTEGIVLLKNKNNVLPLAKDAKVAIIGQHAAIPPIGGGGSARVPVDHLVTPLQGLEARGINFEYHPGVPVYGAVPVPFLKVLSSTSSLQESGKEPKPVRIEWFNGSEFGKNWVRDDMVEKTEYMIKEKWPKELTKDHCTRMTFDITPETSGNHIFSVVTTGTATLYVNGEKIYYREQEPVLQRESFYFFRPKIERLVTHQMEAHRRYTVTLESQSAPWEMAKGSVGGEVTQGSAVGFVEFVNVPQRIRTAAEAAKKADIAILFTGNTLDLESEGFDRTTMDLKPQEYDLVRAVAAANPNTVIVNTSGSPVSLHQIYDNVAGILQAWFPGQESGTSITRILTGEVNPSGRLPVTWPRKIEDTPAYNNWPGTDGDIIRYDEGNFIGYRHYDLPGKPGPLFPFGFGLSYTSFDIETLDLGTSRTLGEDSKLEVSCTVFNTGAVGGKTVVHLYVRRLQPEESENAVSKFIRPVKELKGFRKSYVGPGSSAKLEISFDKYAVSCYDAEDNCWCAEEGVYEILAGFSSREILTTTTFEVEKTFRWTGL